MNLSGINDHIYTQYQRHLLETVKEKTHKQSPFVVTFCEGELTSIDIKTFMENGLKIIRFKMSHVTKADKIGMLKLIKDAVKYCCDKYEVSTWPITLMIDIPNACIRTGYIKETLNAIGAEIKEDTIVELTSNTKYWNKCDSERIFIDDPYIVKSIKIGTEVTIRFGKIVMVCTEVIDEKTLKCNVLRGDILVSVEFVCVRGIKHLKPPLSKIDLELIEFAKEYELDIVTVNSVRWVTTLTKIKNMFKGGPAPLIISSICEQEGLDNIDEIIANSDAIILAREFLAYEIEDTNKMTSIQLQVGAKCKQLGKPFFISGNILEATLQDGKVSCNDVTDITNAVLQGAGFLMRSYTDPAYVLRAMKLLNDISRMVLSIKDTSCGRFWRMCDEYKMPVNAAEACIVASVIVSKQVKSLAFIILTVTGQTAVLLSHIAPEATIMTVSTNPVVARKLQIYRGIIPLIYDKPPQKTWYEEVNERVKFAVAYGLKNDILNYGEYFVQLKKSTPTSAYCDSVSIWKVTTEETKKYKSPNCELGIGTDHPTVIATSNG